MLTQEHVALYNIRLCNRDAAFSAKMFYFLSRGVRTRRAKVTFLVKWRYIYQMKALNELFLLAKVLSSMSVQICIINN